MSRQIKRCFFAALLMAILCVGQAAAEDLLYSDVQADCAARMIYRNECSSKPENLIFWSPDEAFPSLGIGHFIWYPAGISGPFRESFPEFLAFADEMGLVLPTWMYGQPARHAPWNSRSEFLEDQTSERVNELRDFLRDTRREQAQFILRRFQRMFPGILNEFQTGEQRALQEKYDLLMMDPKGALAMADYVNFKGEGLHTDARYDGAGWGLAQVLLEMKIPDDPNQALTEFTAAAQRVLSRRVARSPRPEVESKWLPGWKNRIQRYLTIRC